MAQAEFPIVCWQVNDETVMGKVLGTSMALVDTDARKIKRAASEGISRQIRDGYYIEAPEMEAPQLHVYTVEVQLSYRDDQGSYPLSSMTPFKVAAVYGNITESGFGECYLPYFDESFYYYNQAQRSDLIQHYTREFLQHSDPEQAYQYIQPSAPWLETVRANVSPPKSQWARETKPPKILMELADALPTAKKIRRRMTRLPDAAWEKNQDIAALAKDLVHGKGNQLLVGAQGVGKSTLWNEAIKAATRIEQQELPVTVWRSSCQRLIGKAKYLGQWQEICDQVVEALAQVNGVLWITDFSSLLSTGGQAQEDSIAAYLQSYLQKGQLRLIGEVKPQELELARALLPGFVHQFEVTPVAEMAESQSRRVLTHYANYARSNFGLAIDANAMDLCFQLVKRYLKYERSPGNLVKFFNECLKNMAQASSQTITREVIIEQFVAYTGLPEIVLRDDIALPRDTLRAFFGQRIMGQDQVIEPLCDVIQTFKAGLNDPNKPVATLLMAGPTGVGKTAVTKALAEYFFSAGQAHDPLFSLDMSEFQHPAQISRLIGEQNEPGKLVSHVRNRPFSVILFDEIEKAHPSVFDMLLTVLDEGILTDRFGRVTDFRSSIIVMTSNLGVETGQGLGFVQEDKQAVSLAAIKKHFRPEFFNRIDSVLSFNALGREAILAITRRELEALQARDRIAQEGIKLVFTEEVVAFIAECGFSVAYGARPIQRAIEKHVVGAVARVLLAGKVGGIKEINVCLLKGRVVAK